MAQEQKKPQSMRDAADSFRIAEPFRRNGVIFQLAAVAQAWIDSASGTESGYHAAN